MSVGEHDDGPLRRIEVLGTLEDESDLNRLLALLRPGLGRALELSFYDARVLPREVVEAITRLIDGGERIRIHAYHGYLSHFLFRLGIPAGYVPSRSLGQGYGAFTALALAGSAESLDKILYLVERLPRAGVAVFVVQHILEDVENRLDSLLKMRTDDYSVAMPHHLAPIRPGTIYVAPPGHQMRVAHGMVYLTRDARINHARPSIDVLFESLALEYGAGALAVLLCGYGQDGVKGLAAIKEKGGCVLVEESEECAAARALTEAARVAGQYDLVLGRAGIACFLASALTGRDDNPSEALLERFLEAVSDQYGYNFSGYQQGTVARRVDKLMKLDRYPDFFDFQRDLLGDPGVFERFFVEMSINVTGFFRHPEQFRLLRERILPYLDSFPLVKIWSAGCATGEEAYSLAILLDELGMLEKSQIFATDINGYVLTQARSGLFPKDGLAQGRANYREAGGTGDFDHCFTDRGRYLEIAPRYHERTLFHHHSLVHDGVFNEFQLILCRNVLIYFQSALQGQVLERFSRSLHRDGFLILGPNEGLSALSSRHPATAEADPLAPSQRLFASYDSAQHAYRRYREGAR